MDMMLLRINTFFHASKQLVYSIFPAISFTFTTSCNSQEDNDQAFPISR